MKKVVLFTCLSALCLSGMLSTDVVYAADAVENPGESVKSFTKGKDVALGNESNLKAKSGTEQKFVLKEIIVQDAELKLNEKAMRKITDKLLNKPISMTELNACVNEISVYARKKGYPAAVAYIPEQSVDNGKLVLKVMPGCYGKITIENDTRLNQKYVEQLARGLKKGEIITGRKLETVLYNLTGLSGVRAGGLLKPGSEVGTSDLTIRVIRDKATDNIVYAENYGSDSSGRYRFGLQSSINNIDTQGGRIQVGALVSNKNMQNYNVAYEAFVGPSATKLGVSYARGSYSLGGISGWDDYDGKTDTFSIYGSTPLWHTADNYLNVEYGYRYRKSFSDGEFYTFGYHKDNKTHGFFVGLDGLERGVGNGLKYNFTVLEGKSSGDLTWAGLPFEVEEGYFTKANLDLFGVQSLGKSFDLQLKVQGQLANKTLDDAEQFTLGGPRGVRAYPTGDGFGDDAIFGSAEFVYHTPVKGLDISTYFDIGHVRNKDDDTNDKTLKGWGIGISYTKPNDWFARFDYARRIGGYDNMSVRAESRQQMWFLLGKNF